MLDESHSHRINVKVASPVISLLASVEGATVDLELPLQSPPPPRRPSLGDPPPPPPGDRCALTREIARGGRVVAHRGPFALATVLVHSMATGILYDNSNVLTYWHMKHHHHMLSHMCATTPTLSCGTIIALDCSDS